MNQDNTKDFLNYDDDGKQVLPSGLNILTILTFIGCSLILLITLATPWLIDLGKRGIAEMEKKSSELDAEKLAKLMKQKEDLVRTEANLVPTMIIAIVGVILCFVGALWMRKLKKDGFWLYVAGQAVPIIGSLIVLGTAQYQDWKALVGLAIPLIFIALYATQRKYLVR